MAIVDSFEQWRHLLEVSQLQIIAYNDHKKLTYFQTSRVLSRCQARWAQFLTRFDFLITYLPRVKQGKVDALSRRSYLAPRPGEPAFDHQKQVLLGHDRLRLMATHVFEAPTDSNLLETIRTEIQTDSFAQDILDHIVTGRASCSESKSSRFDYSKFKWYDGLLF